MDSIFRGRSQSRRTTRRTLPKGRKVSMTGKARLTKPVAKAVATVAKRVFARKTETKFVTRLVENNVAHNSTIGGSDYYRVMPIVPVGDDEQSRTGDKISPLSLTVKGNVAISRSDSITVRNSALMVRILVLQLKAGKNYTTSQTLWQSAPTGSSYYNRLLKRNDDGGGIENVQFLGNQNELFLPVNRDVFDVLGERFIKLSSLNPAGETAGSNSVEAAPINAIAKNFNMKLRGVPKTIRYDSALNTAPAAYAPFMAVGYAYMDGSSYDTVDTRVVVSAQAHLYYKDA